MPMSAKKVSQKSIRNKICRVEASISFSSHWPLEDINLDKPACTSATRKSSSFRNCNSCNLAYFGCKSPSRSAFHNAVIASLSDLDRRMAQKNTHSIDKNSSVKKKYSVTHDVSLQFMEGLDDASKFGDVYTVERLLYALAKRLDSLASVSTILSAGGIQKVALVLKTFMHHSWQNPLKEIVKEPNVTQTNSSCKDKGTVSVGCSSIDSFSKRHCQKEEQVTPCKSKMTLVVSAGCFLLKKLIDVVLQCKEHSESQALVGEVNEKNYHTCLVEMYVALTEAFIEILQPLQGVPPLPPWCFDCLAKLMPILWDAFSRCGTIAEKNFQKKATTPSEASQVDPGFLISCSIHFGNTEKAEICNVTKNHDSGDVTENELVCSCSGLATMAVPKKAEQALRSILQFLHSQSYLPVSLTVVALHVLSIYLSVVPSPSLMFDALSLTISSMKKNLRNEEVQIQGLVVIDFVAAALDSAKALQAWDTVTTCMEHHKTNVDVQREGCRTLQELCLGIIVGDLHKADEDSAREDGVCALVSAMSQFPEDIRIQYYACMTLSSLIHGACKRSIFAMLTSGVISATISAMSLCKTNETIQVEACRILYTICKVTAVDHNYHTVEMMINPASNVNSFENGDDCDATQKGNSMTSTDKDHACYSEENRLVFLQEWRAAFWVFLGAMNVNKTSESVQEYCTYIIASILQMFTGKELFGYHIYQLFYSNSSAQVKFKKDVDKASLFHWFIVDGIRNVHDVFEVIIRAMAAFPTNKVIQIGTSYVLEKLFQLYLLTANVMHISNGEENDEFVEYQNNDLKDTSYREYRSQNNYSNNFGQSSRLTDGFARVHDSNDFIDYVLLEASLLLHVASKFVAVFFMNEQSSVSSHTCKKLPMKLTGMKFCCNVSASIFPEESWLCLLRVIGKFLCKLSEHLRDFSTRVSNDFSSTSIDDQSPEIAIKQFLMVARKYFDSKRDLFNANSLEVIDATHNKILEHKLSSNDVFLDLPSLLTKAIQNVHRLLSMLRDSDARASALQALPNLYEGYRTVCVKINQESDTQTLRQALWNDEDVGIDILLDCVGVWKDKTTLNIAILSMHALFCACKNVAASEEINRVFGHEGSGTKLLVSTLQKAVNQNIDFNERKKLLKWCLNGLSIICRCSFDVEFSYALTGGADLVVAALNQYSHDEEICESALKSLGISLGGKHDFLTVLSAAVERNLTFGKGKSSKKKKHVSNGANAVVGLSHIFDEFIFSSKASLEDKNSSEQSMEEKRCTQIRSVLNLSEHSCHLFQTLVAASPRCGGPIFTVELLKYLNNRALNGMVVTDTQQGHICELIGYMANHSATWRKDFINGGVIEAVLLTMEIRFQWRKQKFSFCKSFDDFSGMPGTPLQEIEVIVSEEACTKTNTSISENGIVLQFLQPALRALLNLVKDPEDCNFSALHEIIQAITVLLHSFGGLQDERTVTWSHRAHPTSKLLRPSFFTNARQILAQLGVTRINGRNLCQMATEVGDLECLKILVSKGVDVCAQDSLGRTALWYAQKSHQDDIVQFLKSHLNSCKMRSHVKAKNVKRGERCKKHEVTPPKKKEITENGIQSSDTSSIRELDHRSVGGIFNESNCLQNGDKPTVKEKMQGNFGEDNVTSRVANVKSEKVGKLNSMLQEALVSGNKEKLELSLRTCESRSAECNQELIKKVKASLQKKVRRHEKYVNLEEELNSSLRNGDKDCLAAAILAIESVPRYVTLLQQKLNAAREELRKLEALEIEAQKNIQVSEVAQTSECLKDKGKLQDDKPAAEIEPSKEYQKKVSDNSSDDFKLWDQCEPQKQSKKSYESVAATTVSNSFNTVESKHKPGQIQPVSTKLLNSMQPIDPVVHPKRIETSDHPKAESSHCRNTDQYRPCQRFFKAKLDDETPTQMHNSVAEEVSSQKTPPDTARRFSNNNMAEPANFGQNLNREPDTSQLLFGFSGHPLPFGCHATYGDIQRRSSFPDQSQITMTPTLHPFHIIDSQIYSDSIVPELLHTPSFSTESPSSEQMDFYNKFSDNEACCSYFLPSTLLDDPDDWECT